MRKLYQSAAPELRADPKMGAIRASAARSGAGAVAVKQSRTHVG